MGVFHTLTCAKAYIIKDCLKGLRYYDVYNPSMRFYKNDIGDYWEDHWQVLGVPLYRIEVFRQDEKQESFHINFDAHLKKYILQNRLSSSQVKDLLLDWKRNAWPGQQDLLMSWFDFRELSFLDRSTDDDVQTWVALHGSTACSPYPMRPYIENLDNLHPI
jgi:hypothetical protein